METVTGSGLPGLGEGRDEQAGTEDVWGRATLWTVGICPNPLNVQHQVPALVQTRAPGDDGSPRFTDRNKCTPRAGADEGEGGTRVGAGSRWKIPAPSVQACCEFKTALKIVDQLKTYEITPKTRGPEGGHCKQRAEGSQRRKSRQGRPRPAPATRGS